MRLGIQPKLVITLVLAGLLPLALTLGVVLMVISRQRIDTVGQSFRAQARLQATHIATLLSSQVDFIWVLTRLPGTNEFLDQANSVPPLTDERIAEIERWWLDHGRDDGLVQETLDNPLARRWQAIQRQQPRFAEVIITDVTGRLVAATNKTTDYYQADEEWWQECFAQGRGNIIISDVSFDESAIADDGRPGALVVNVCIPILNNDATVDHPVLGVLKVSLSAEWLLDQIESNMYLGYASALTWLIHSDGRPISRDPSLAQPPEIPEPMLERIRDLNIGWSRQTGIPGGEVMGFSAIKFPAHGASSVTADWFVVVAASHEETVRPLHQLTLILFIAGMALIAICFSVGLFIARREIIRPIRLLGAAAGELEHGNIDYRLPLGDDIFRKDELGRLAGDFNRMADELRDNLRRLRAADETKRQFIDLASHELRTPITYILGVTDLARRRNDDPDGVMGKLNQRAVRLMRIVDNMFKLLQDGQFDLPLNWAEVDLAALVRSACDELQPFLAQRRQRWDFRIEPGLPVIHADRDKLRDVLTNLVSNAIRFSPDDHEVRVELKRAGNRIEMLISNTGPAIPSEDLPRLFQPFFTGRQPLQHTSGDYTYLTRGLGLGLSVVKRFVELHGGAISVESAPERTTFRVTLPTNRNVPLHTE